MAKQCSALGLNWFQNARFGMFVHWGPISVAARHDWLMYGERLSASDYEPIAYQFNPTKFDADEWVRTAADAGQKYIVYITRHHDGFSMYDTGLSDYKVTNTALKCDPLRELANAIAKRGDMKLGVYHSLLDWRHPAYRANNEAGLPWSDYLEFLHGQVRELCTHYGELACVWFDGDWPRQDWGDDNPIFKPGGSFEYERLYNMIHTLQPDAVVSNNRHDAPLPGEDVQGFEQDLPGVNSTGWQYGTVSQLPLEVCMTIDDYWFHINDSTNYKSTRTLLHYLVRSASAGANYLLNTGPTSAGKFQLPHITRLRAIGAWLRTNGESIYATRKGVIPPTPVSVSTRRGDTHYVHILNDVSDWVVLTGVPDTVKDAALLHDGSLVRMERNSDKVTLHVPEERRFQFDTVVVLN